MTKPIDFEALFNLYYPVIAEARKVRARYCTAGKMKVCPDETGALIEALNAAEKIINIEREE